MKHVTHPATRRTLSRLIPLIALAAGAVARGDDAIRMHFGVMVVQGHLDQTIVPDKLADLVMKPVFDRTHNPYERWVEWAKTSLAAQAETRPHVARHVRRTPPWRYTPTDFTYHPKTDWTYRPHVGNYQSKDNWTYTPTTDWTYRPKWYGSW